MAPKILFVAENLRLNIGRQVIFDQAAMSLYEGERVALVGRNGCGKSTLLRVVSGLDTVSDGTVSFARGLRTAMLPQDFELDETLTVRENVAQGLAWFEELLCRYNTATGAEHDEI